MHPIAALTDAFLAEHFDELTLHRARHYVGIAVDDLEVSHLSAGSVTATADVFGTRATPYRVQLHTEVNAAGGWIFSVCTCPVRSMCKHGAAVAMTLRRSFVGEERTPPWQRRLDAIVSELAEPAHAPHAPTALALQFALADGTRYYHRDRPQLRVRPMRPGKKGGWIKTGAEWPMVIGISRSLPPAQREALLDLHSALETNRGYAGSDPAPTLDRFGRNLPRLLRAAERAGVPFLTDRSLVSVDVPDATARVAGEVRLGDTARFALEVEVDGELAHDSGVQLIGSPPSVVALLDEGRVRILPLADELPRSLADLLLDGPVDIPLSDLAAFRHRLEGMVRHLTIHSPDDADLVPAPIRPTLQVTVTWESSTEAALTWEWRYDDRRCDLDAVDGLGGLRDPDGEAAIRATVADDLLGRRTATGGDALALAIHELPHLRGLDDVDVVEEQRPDFREATDGPEISFDVVAPDEHEDADEAVTDWLDLAVTVTVEGERVPLPDVLAALTLGEEFLVLPSGLFVPTDRPEFDRLRDVVAAAAELRESDGDRVSVGKHDLGVWAQLAELGVVDAQAAEWVRRAQALRDLTDLPRPEPVGLTTTLRSYQREGFWWLAFLHDHGLGGILADDMGLGKTLQVLALVQHAVFRGADAPFLVVAPTSVVTAWRHEAARHAPGLRVGVVARRTDDVAAIAAESDLVVTTYTLLRLEQRSFADHPWAGLVLDEAQQVKNHQSKTYAAARLIEAPFRLAVTGTPFENRLMELWALLSLATPGLYPWPRRFRELVVRPVERAGDEAALRRFRERIRPFLLRRTKETVADDLPPKQEQLLEVDLEDRHRRIYDTHLAKARQRILGLVDDFERNRVAIFSALTTLRQLALDPALVDDAHARVGSAKLELVAEHLAEITAEGHRALVFSSFTSYLRRVRDRLDADGIATTYLDGRTRDRAAAIESFRTGEAPVFLISLKAGGVGLTLTEADYVYVLDPWWNPAAEAQAVDRAHRIGQDKHVHVYRLVATDTIEEKVMELKARKAALFAQVVDGDGAMGTAIDAEDIRRLFED